jgi:hypothetical protein
MFDGLQQTIDQLASWLSPVANKKKHFKRKKKLKNEKQHFCQVSVLYQKLFI